MLFTYISRHLLRAAVTVWAVSLVAFGLARLSGDPSAVLIPPDASPVQRERLIDDFGLDEPLPVQYLTFAASALRGDFGDSLRFREDASRLYFDRIANTLLLAGASAAIALIGGGSAGLLSAARAGRTEGRALLATVVAIQGIPSFVAGLLLMTVFAVELRWLPTSGNDGPSAIVLPAVSLALFPLGTIARLVRTAALESLRSDYIRTARMKGLHPRTVALRHVLPHSLMPALTAATVHVAYFVGGSAIVETVFAWPGIGHLAIQAVLARDYTLVQTIVLYTSVLVVAMTILLDTGYAFIDPRTRRRP